MAFADSFHAISTRAASSSDPAGDDIALARAARNDATAFSELYARYLTPIYRYCLVRLGSQHAAEDATSEVFLRALNGISGYRGGSFPAWIYRIAANVLNDAHRRSVSTAPIDEATEVEDDAPGPEALVGLSLDLNAVRAALASLSQEQRSAIELRAAGWSWQQVGEALGGSADAARMACARGLIRVRHALDAADRTEPTSIPEVNHEAI